MGPAMLRSPAPAVNVITNPIQRMIAVKIACARARLTEYGHRRTAGLPRSGDSAVGPIALITGVIGFLQSRLTHAHHTEKSPYVSNTDRNCAKCQPSTSSRSDGNAARLFRCHGCDKACNIERSTFLHTDRTATIGLTCRKYDQRSLGDNAIWFAADRLLRLSLRPPHGDYG
jgi:hypothetical protein